MAVSESFLEHRQFFATSWVNRWTLPNPFFAALYENLKELGVTLGDFAFNTDSSTLADIFLNVAIPKFDAAAKIALDSVTFSAANPDWATASSLVSVFDRIARVVSVIAEATPLSQQSTLALHVSSETVDFHAATASLVRTELLGDAKFYGIALHRDAGTLIIDKSVKFERAAFIRLQRTFLGTDQFADIASKLYEDELFAFSLLGAIDRTGASQ